MQLFLQIVGALVVALVLLVIVGFFGLRWWLKRKLGEKAFELMKLGQQPVAARITLRRTDEPAHHPEPVQSLVDELVELGYQPVGRFSVPEMATMLLWAGVHPADGSVAVVYDHSALDPFFDVVRAYQDSHSLTVSSTRMHNPRNIRPGSRVVADAELRPTEARGALLADTDAREVFRYERDNFVEAFQDAYARGMDYLLARGGPDAQDLELNVEQFDGPHDLNDDQKRQALELTRSSHLAALEEALLDRFLETGQVSARDWQRLSDRAVVVHEKLRGDEAASLALAYCEWELSHPPIAEIVARQASALELFEAVNALVPEDQKHRLLGQVDAPVAARFYLSPE